MFDVTYLGALGAGVLSFLSPCVLPLVPPYLCFIAGVSMEEMVRERQPDCAAAPDGGARTRVMLSALAFVLGFGTVFVALGATASAASALIADHMMLLSQIAGAVIIVLGLHFLGVFRIALLFREARFHPASKPAGLVGAYVVGLAFAFGWTPCVGPVLAAILMVAASEQSMAYGASLLGVYALGIGLPFLLAALAMDRFLGFMRRFRRHLGRVEQVMGGLLVVTGILFLTGTIPEIAGWLLETFPVLGRIG